MREKFGEKRKKGRQNETGTEEGRKLAKRNGK